MKLKESGMPEEEMWKEFFEPDKILKILGIDKHIVNAVDFGCGYGTFTIPIAKRISGKIYALDIEPKMIKETQRKAREHRLRNVKVMLRDFMSDGSGLKDKSMDYVILFNAH